MSLVFIQIAADNFTPNANPLNPTNWTQASDFANPLQALGGFCVTPATDGAELYTGVAFPNDQYAQIKLSAIGNSDTASLGIRVDPSGDTTGVFFNVLSSTGTTLSIDVTDGTNTLYSNAAIAFSLGDVFKLAAIGTSVTLYQNGILITAVTPIVPAAPSGVPFISLFASPTSTKLSNFSAGSVTVGGLVYSVPDCRNYGHFPNSSRSVNATLIYDVQVSSNPSIPGTDSRKAGAPVDSSTQPQNSRTPGTYGPGE